MQNPIALIEATASSRSAVVGALATDPVVPSRTADTTLARPKWRSASSMLAAVRRPRGRHDEPCPPVAQPRPRTVGAPRHLDR
jgi:hypothetical protein